MVVGKIIGSSVRAITERRLTADSLTNSLMFPQNIARRELCSEGIFRVDP